MTALNYNNDKKSQKKKVTKRQRRKGGPNPSNTWQQQPNAKSSEARDRFYLADAGLSQVTNKAKVRSSDLEEEETKFGRLLGGTNPKQRHRAVERLQNYLKARSDIQNVEGGISELDLMKLWKGLWYTLYMADRVPVQEELSKRIANLIWSMAGTEEEDEYAAQLYLHMDQLEDDDDDSSDADNNCLGAADDAATFGAFDDDANITEDRNQQETQLANTTTVVNTPPETKNVIKDDDSLEKHCRGAHLAALYVRTFYRTVQREWCNMDKYRVDKFYTLIRYMTAQVYTYMAKRHWNLGILRLFNDSIMEEVFSQNVSGVKYHLIDICLEELAKVNTDDADMKLTEATFLDCLEPYWTLSQCTDDRSVHARVMEKVLDCFLKEYSVVATTPKEIEGAKSLVMKDVHVGTVAKFIFELASDATTTKDRYRKELYNMHKTYMKRLKVVGKDVAVDDDDDVAEDQALDVDKAFEVDKTFEEGDKDSDSFEEIVEESDALKKNENRDTITVKDKNVALSEPFHTGANDDNLIDILPTVEEGTKKNKKKRKKKPKKAEEEGVKANDTAVPPKKSTDNVTHEEEIKSKATNNVKKGDSSAKDEDDDRNVEVEIIISTRDQKKAVSKAAAAAKKSVEAATKTAHLVVTTTSTANELSSSGSKVRSPPSVTPHAMADSDAVHSDEEFVQMTQHAKRVKFGKVNHCKSYKASMTDLQLKELQSTSVCTPERSILLKKNRNVDDTAFESRTSVEKNKVSKKRRKDTPRKKAAIYS